MKWLAISSALKASRSKIVMNAAVKRRKKRAAPSGGGGRALFRVLLAGAVLVGIGTGTWYLAAHASYFTIRNLEVANNHSYLPEEIIAMAGLAPGENIFQTDLSLYRQRLMRETNIRDVAVERVFPDTIRLRVFEREPRARVKFGRYYTVDDWGVVLRDRKEESTGHLPVILGLKVRNGQIFPPEEGEKCLAVLKALDQQGISSWLDVDEINLTDPELIVMHTARDLEVKLAAHDVDYQLKRLKVVLPHVTGESRARSVDLRYAHVPVVFDD